MMSQPWGTPTIRRTRLSAALALSLASITGCTGSPQDQAGSSNGHQHDAAAGDGHSNVMGELADALLSEPPTTTPRPIAAQTATMGEDDFAREVTVEVYEVTVRKHDTFMNWSLSTPEGVVRIIGPETSMSQTSGARGEGGFTVADTDKDSASMVALELPDSDRKTLWPLHRPVGADGQEKDKVGCLCSGIPDYLSQEPQMMNGLYPKLPDNTETVSLKIEGFPRIENIPVTRS